MINGLTKQFFRKPMTTGAICASSLHLARQMTKKINLETAGVVVELGPGTGAITGEILKKLAPLSIFFAIELNQAVIPSFSKKFPEQIIYHDTAANLPNLLRLQNLSHADVILSGLPWTLFSASVQDEILEAITDSLPKGGFFTTFAYLHGAMIPSGIRFRQKLHENFRKVSTSKIIWDNIPPAFVYKCQK